MPDEKAFAESGLYESVMTISVATLAALNSRIAELESLLRDSRAETAAKDVLIGNIRRMLEEAGEYD